MIVDSHVHVWSADREAYPFRPILAHVPAPTKPAPIERLIADMDRARVDKAILVQPSAYGPDHRYLKGCLEAWPGRFAGICQIDLRAAVPRADFERLCADGLYRGLRLNTIRQGDMSALTGAQYESLFAAIADSGLSLSFHMDIDQAPVVARLAARHGTLPVIVDYLGPHIHARRDVEPCLDLLASEPNIHCKLLCTAEDAASPYPFPDIAVFYRKILDRFGPSRTLFGSDYPGAARICDYKKLIAWGETFPGLGAADRAQVMGGTARRLFGLT
ncbi:amidohydrolase family protein [Taklimakanibacter deserti]|uniref:amidohydrolase family protein n=1 Tax=Taklimakanibacter deserti TaxID=2267839 RepID=UPI000E650E0C